MRNVNDEVKTHGHAINFDHFSPCTTYPNKGINLLNGLHPHRHPFSTSQYVTKGISRSTRWVS